jgi:RNA polymerase sigma factor (sigma-70 family)
MTSPLSERFSSDSEPPDVPHTGVGLDNWDAKFPATHWTLLLEARDDHDQQSLASMCQAYWYPLYAYLRKTGYSSHDAQDLTQGFFAHLFSADRLGNVDPRRGKFRSYLLGALKHYASDVRAHDRAIKRGGNVKPVSIEQDLAEERYQSEPVDEQLTADKVFDRQWAIEVFRQVLEQVENDYATQDKMALFKTLHPYLTGEADRGDYRDAAAKLGLKEPSVRSAVSRLRKNYRRRIREFIEQQVDSPDDVEEELRCLSRAIS